MEYTRGRIVLTYYLRFPLLGIGLYFLILVGMALFSGEPLLYELRVYRILPLIIALYFALIPLSLLIGFWMGKDYTTSDRRQLMPDGVIKGAVTTGIYSFLLLSLNYIFRDTVSFWSVIIDTLGFALLGALFSFIIARGIVNKGDEALKKDF